MASSASIGESACDGVSNLTISRAAHFQVCNHLAVINRSKEVELLISGVPRRVGQTLPPIFVLVVRWTKRRWPSGVIPEKGLLLLVAMQPRSRGALWSTTMRLVGYVPGCLDSQKQLSLQNVAIEDKIKRKATSSSKRAALHKTER